MESNMTNNQRPMKHFTHASRSKRKERNFCPTFLFVCFRISFQKSGLEDIRCNTTASSTYSINFFLRRSEKFDVAKCNFRTISFQKSNIYLAVLYTVYLLIGSIIYIVPDRASLCRFELCIPPHASSQLV